MVQETERISTRSGVELWVDKWEKGEELELLLRLKSHARCILHWGLRRPQDVHWQPPPPDLWPEGTTAHGHHAVQTPFSGQNGNSQILIRLGTAVDISSLEFALFFPQQRRWDNNGGRNYRVEILRPTVERPPLKSAAQALKGEVGQAQVVFEQVFHIREQGELAAAVTREGATFRVRLVANLPGPLLFHWGIAQEAPQEWLLPPEWMRPPGTVLWQNTTQTPFTFSEDLNRLELTFAEAKAPLGLQFVLKKGDTGDWLQNEGRNFYIPVLPGPRPYQPLDTGALEGLAQRMIQMEMGNQSWTLMHRFNLCYDLIPHVRRSPEGLAMLFVWLRYSSLRQLTWQRNYNTKPRELSHSEDRLTQKLAEIFHQEPASRPLVRLMLTTVGKGGEGQRVRDEILHIMHRHRIKEVAGHFLEEWHQKLHNNTTPDDIVICEAYLAFLRHNGDVNKFYEVLGAGGVTRERLQSFERPIRSEPDFPGHLKDGLIHDFENFLRILKSVHAGTDLETALNESQSQLDGETRDMLYQLWDRRGDPSLSVVNRVNLLTAIRKRLNGLLNTRTQVRDLLYLDLALEQFLRGIIEQNIHLQHSGDEWVELIGRVLENLSLSQGDPELALCSAHWERLKGLSRFGQEWSLHAKAVLDRVARGLSRWIDSTYQLLQPKAEFLGNAFKADAWIITLFSEEVVRGNSLGFVLSMLLHHLEPILRQTAQLGNWQIISRGQGWGTVEVVEALRSVQGKRFSSPTIIIADKVMGDEEIPEGITAVIAPDVTDIVSHVAVRARNAKLLFASCYDPKVLEKLKSLRGHRLALELTPAGDVLFRETTEPSPLVTQAAPRALPTGPRPVFTSFAVGIDEFRESVVGKKSLHQLWLRGKLPSWIRQPESVAIPFGVCEEMLAAEQNRPVAEAVRRLTDEIEHETPKVLEQLRQELLQLSAPEQLRSALREKMNQAGLSWPEKWEDAWTRVKQVWASKWNERACLSRRARGIADEALFMAVLIQEVIEAECAFVIHTVNPMSGNRDEVFAEIVLGLGETLVGNYPGRALSFTWDKKTGKFSLLSYPGKSLGLYGSGLIFRSDSNGEDLAGYAGAGLYDSVLLHPPRQELLDYTREPLVWDANFRADLLSSIGRLGMEVEKALGAPQDIEGAVVNGEYFVVQTRPQV